MSKQALAGPLGELHFGDELWLDPVNAAATRRGRRRIHERRLGLFELFHAAIEIVQQSIIEPGAHPTGIDQPPRRLVDAEKECSESGSSPFRFGISADDEFLAARTLCFDPVAPA